MMIEAELTQMQARVVRFLAARGVFDEDLTQEMLLVLLEREGKASNLRWVYLRALDRLNPRIGQHGVRVRRHSWESSLDAPLTPDGDADWHAVLPLAAAEDLPDLQALHTTGPLRALLLMRLVYGYSEKELAWIWGVTEGRISQLLGGGRSAVLCGHVPDHDLWFGALTWEVQWITL